MLDVEKIIRIDICTNSGDILQSLTNGYSFPKKYVEDVIVDNILMVKGKNLPLYSRNDPLDIVIFTKTGDRISYSSYVNLSTEDQLNISMSFGGAKVLEERRRFFKVECDIYCRLTMIRRGEEKEIIDPPIDCDIKNISLGGVFISPRSIMPDFSNGELVTAFVPDFNGVKANFVLNIIRRQEFPIIGYGCKFFDLQMKQEDILAKYINMLQIQKKQKNL